LKKLSNYIETKILNRINNLLKYEGEENLRKETFSFLFIRILSLLKSIIDLRKSPDIQLLPFASRLLFEIKIDLVLLHTGGEKSIEKYNVYYKEVDRFQKAQKFVKAAQKNSHLGINIEGALEYLSSNKQNILDKKRILWDKDENKMVNNWLGIDRKKMAEEANLLKDYIEMYSLYSSFAHSGFALMDYASAEWLFKFKFAPLQRIIFLTIDSMEIICGEFERPITKEMLQDSMEPEFEEVYMMINQLKKGP